MKKIIIIIIKNKWIFLLAFILGSICYFLEGIGDPLLVKLLVDEGIGKRNFKFFIIIALIFLLFTIFFRFVALSYNLLTQKIKIKINKDLTSLMFKNYYSLPYEEIIKNEEGYFISRIYDEPLKISEMIVDIFLFLFMISIGLISAFFFCLYLSWRITLLLLIIVPILHILSNKYAHKIKEKSKEEKEAEGKLREFIGSSVRSYITANIFNVFEYLNKKLNEFMENFFKIFYFRYKISSIYSTTSRIFINFGQVMVIILAGFEVIKGNLTAGGLLGFLFAFERVIYYGQSIIETFPHIFQLLGYIERIKEFESKVSNKIIKEDFDKIILKNIEFSYKDKKIFDNLNLEIKKGEKVLIVGQNGSGKTTLLKIICGFLKPQKGVIEFPNPNRISCALTPFVFLPGSVKDNLNVCDNKNLIKILIKRFNLENNLKKDTGLLSAGERKKLEIIMVLCKNADIYIFDEPLASIDEESKDIIIKTIFENAKDKTIIATIHGEEKYYKYFDRIINLDDLKIND
jgi:ABC-type multidrug transport system fused ATPase/permease subunit